MAKADNRVGREPIMEGRGVIVDRPEYAHGCVGRRSPDFPRKANMSLMGYRWGNLCQWRRPPPPEIVVHDPPIGLLRCGSKVVPRAEILPEGGVQCD